MEEAHLELRNLSKAFGDDVAVDDVSLKIRRGNFACLLGPSGCGKTTTLRMIAGFIEPDSGDVLIGGASQRGLLANNRPTSIVFQDYALFPHMTVKDNVAYGLRARKLSKGETEERTQEALELMGLGHLADRFPGQLSGGQQQRVALGRSVAVEPEVLLMDEPLSNLDAKLRVRLRTDLRELQQRLGITTVYVTHDQEEALAMGDEVAVMSKGKLEQLGAPYELYDRPQTPFVADFMGLNNFIPCEVGRHDANSTEVSVAQGHTVVVDARRVSGGDLAVGERAALVVRPEALEVFFELPENSDELLECTLIGSQFLGSLRRNWVNFAGAEMVVDEYSPSPKEALKSGTPVWLRLPSERYILMKGGDEKVMRHGSLP
jgi:ABC-type Fe3+/spermidine/putrescine transport system ATPase subunit